MLSPTSVLIIDDDTLFAQTLANQFQSIDWVPTVKTSYDDTLHYLPKAPSICHCVLDLNINNHSGLTLIQPILNAHPSCKILILTGFASINASIDAIKLGAVYLLSKPCSFSTILSKFSHCAPTKELPIPPHPLMKLNGKLSKNH